MNKGANGAPKLGVATNFSLIGSRFCSTPTNDSPCFFLSASEELFFCCLRASIKNRFISSKATVLDSILASRVSSVHVHTDPLHHDEVGQGLEATKQNRA